MDTLEPLIAFVALCGCCKPIFLAIVNKIFNYCYYYYFRMLVSSAPSYQGARACIPLLGQPLI